MLMIEVTTAEALLLADAEWHAVKPGSLTVEGYGYSKHGHQQFSADHTPGLASCGWTAVGADGSVLSGPLASLLAVRTAAPKRGS